VLWCRYESALRGWAGDREIVLPTIGKAATQSYHMFYILLPSPTLRDRLVAHLKRRSILAVSHYVPLNTSTVGVALGGRPGDCPVAERVAERVLRLPFYTNMTEDEQAAVIEAVLEFR
jgi:dTDP-4-amino-4,6-dideoxygalactose transaminase